MKYISILILLALMIWTWSLATTERSFKLEQHKQVEAGVEQDVRSFIQRKFPTVKEIYCSQLFTEIVKPGEELIARFRCQAAGEVGSDVAQQTYEGHLNLKSTDQFKTWSETGGEIRSPEVSFVNGVHISAKGDGSAAESEAPAQATPVPAKPSPTPTPRPRAPKATPAESATPPAATPAPAAAEEPSAAGQASPPAQEEAQ